jgi:hypothetical protein
MSQLLATITVDGTAYRGSIRGFAGQNFYQPFVKRMPSLELGQVEDSGKIGVKFGNITLTNDYLNASHPFALQRYEDLVVAPSLYPTSLKWGEAGSDLFSGNIFLQSVSETEITFALTDDEYTLGARPFTLTENFVFLESVTVPGGGAPVSITALNHQFVSGTVVIFEKMDTYGQLLEYSGVSADNYYYVVRTSSNTFTLQDKNFVPVTSGVGTAGTFTSDGDTHRVGVPLRVPFSWGIVKNVTPVIKKKDDEVANPDLQTNNSSYPIEIREDGVLIYSTDNTSSEFWNGSGGSGVAPTSTVIKLNAATTGGVLSISGISTRGSTLLGAYQYVATQLGLTLDTSLA